MNNAAYQEKEKNEKTGKSKGEKRKQSTDFKGAACCPSAIVQRAERQKKGLYEGTAGGNWDPREGRQPF